MRIPWRVNLPWMILLPILIVGIAAAFLGALGGGLAGYFLLDIMPNGSSAPELFGQNLLALPVLFGAFALWPPVGRLAGKLGLRPLKWADLGIAVTICAAVIMLGGALTSVWQPLLDLTGIPYTEKQSLLISFATAPWWELIMMGVLLIVAVPVGEEILFRRVLFGLLRPLGAWNGILLTSLIFSLVHFFLFGIPALFVMGLGFQLAYLLRRNLSTAILTHGLVNTCALIATLLEPYLPVN